MTIRNNLITFLSTIDSMNYRQLFSIVAISAASLSAKAQTEIVVRFNSELFGNATKSVTNPSPVTAGGVTITFLRGNSTMPVKFDYATQELWMYGGSGAAALNGNEMSFKSSTGAIGRIQFIAGSASNMNPPAWTADSGEISFPDSQQPNNPEWTGNAEEVKFTCSRHASNPNTGTSIHWKEVRITIGSNSAIEEVMADDTSAPTEYFNLQGIRIDATDMPAGIYIRRRGSEVKKVYVR